MHVIKSQMDWLKEHARFHGSDKTWYCKITNKPMLVHPIGRSIWERPFSGGFGEVRQVNHITCSGCDPNPNLPTHGRPIYEDELVEVGVATSPS